MATQLDQESAMDWEPVPPGHPDRAAFESRMRELGVRPTTNREPRPDRKVFRRRGWTSPATLRYKLVRVPQRIGYGPDSGPLTDEEMRIIMSRQEKEDDLPDLVPPDDPCRLAWEAELRAIGVRPAVKWRFPDREPVRRAGLWQRIKYRISLGW
ncbi:MAG TPA: hypothetical protein VHG93_28045 [Longimicrobium sp.]|nr:hypothetical protein [Longimicrobium sp.]